MLEKIKIIVFKLFNYIFSFFNNDENTNNNNNNKVLEELNNENKKLKQALKNEELNNINLSFELENLKKELEVLKDKKSNLKKNDSLDKVLILENVEEKNITLTKMDIIFLSTKIKEIELYDNMEYSEIVEKIKSINVDYLYGLIFREFENYSFDEKISIKKLIKLFLLNVDDKFINNEIKIGDDYDYSIMNNINKDYKAKKTKIEEIILPIYLYGNGEIKHKAIVITN